jgi:protein TonB
MISVSPSAQQLRTASSYTNPAQVSLPGITCVVIAHVGVFVLLFSLEVVPLPPPLATLMVHMIPALPVAEHAPSTPKPPQRQTLEKTTKSTTPRPTPGERKKAPESKPDSLPPTQLLTAQSGTADVSTEPRAEKHSDPAQSSEAHPSAPAPVTAARFDADYLRNSAPIYPALARRLGEEGKLVLRVFVTPEGRPGQIELKTSSGSPRLDLAAQDAVARWKFVPARRADEAIGAWVLIPIIFNLRD